MARVQFGPVISDLRGKVGGVIFQRSAQGVTLRKLTVPVNPSSPSQVANRAQLFYLQSQWQALDQDQRTAWETWASYQNQLVGQFVQATQSGQQSFVQCNRYRQLANKSVLVDPVFTPYSQPQPSLTIVNPLGILKVTLTGMTDSDAYYPFIYLSPPLPPARNSRPSLVRLIGPLTPESDTLWRIEEAYTNAYGIDPQLTDRLWYQLGIQQVDNGALSIFTSGVITIT